MSLFASKCSYAVFWQQTGNTSCIQKVFFNSFEQFTFRVFFNFEFYSGKNWRVEQKSKNPVYCWTREMQYIIFSDYLSKFLLLFRVYEITVRSMNIDHRPTNDWTQGPSTHFGKFQMAVTLQCVDRSPSCLVLGWGFWRTRKWLRKKLRFSGF